jgi:hypothetical protein
MKATQTIWRTVVFAGAMLGAPACKSKQPNTTPSNTATSTDTKASTETTTPPKPDTQNQTPPPPPDNGDPCAGGEVARPRGTGDGGGGHGRGFILS